MGVKWQGEQLVSEIKKRLKAGLDQAAEYTTGAAKLRAPVDTGTLRKSIDWGGHSAGSFEWRIIGTPVEYGLYQEVGYLAGGKTFVQNPYLLPALTENKEILAKIVLQHFGT